MRHATITVKCNFFKKGPRRLRQSEALTIPSPLIAQFIKSPTHTFMQAKACYACGTGLQQNNLKLLTQQAPATRVALKLRRLVAAALHRQ
mmetsp:Transcript_26000/g.50594  ORF Transcript_26000/g.50594 Transcript_26000/m.50594 type:complete len:90 (-) Transcript_26000:114-383(-)